MGYNKLIICGNSRIIAPSELDGAEVWALRTGIVWGADRYWDFHGMIFPEPTYRFKDIPIDKLHAIGLPLTNSICILVAYATYTKKYKQIIIKGSPLFAKEYNTRITDLAYICGWAKGKGISIHWEQSLLDFVRVYMGGVEA